MSTQGIPIVQRITSSFVEFPPFVSEVLFFPGCFLRCNYCYNGNVVNYKAEKDPSPLYLSQVVADLRKPYRREFTDAIVISGGDPLIHLSNKEFIDTIHTLSGLGYKLRIDTSFLSEKPLREYEGIESLMRNVSFGITIKPLKYYGPKFPDILKDNLTFLIEHHKKRPYVHNSLRFTIPGGSGLEELRNSVQLFHPLLFKEKELWSNVQYNPVRYFKDAEYLGTPEIPYHDEVEGFKNMVEVLRKK